MSNEETHVVLCVLEGAIPDGRIYSELSEAELNIIVEALDSHLDGLIDTKKELWKEDQEPHQQYIEEAKATFDDIASSPTPKPLAYCDYCNQWADGGTACCNEYDGSVHYKENERLKRLIEEVATILGKIEDFNQ